MKLDLDEKVGPILGILAGNLVVAPVFAQILGEIGLLVLVPWASLADSIRGQDTGLAHGEAFMGGASQGILYSIILVTACLLGRLGRTAVWLFRIHAVAAAIAIIWRLLCPSRP